MRVVESHVPLGVIFMFLHNTSRVVLGDMFCVTSILGFVAFDVKGLHAIKDCASGCLPKYAALRQTKPLPNLPVTASFTRLW